MKVPIDRTSADVAFYGVFVSILEPVGQKVDNQECREDAQKALKNRN